MRCLRCWGWLLAAALLSSPVLAAPLTREQALAAVEQPDPAARLAGVDRLADIGAPADAERLLPRLLDSHPRIRHAAEAAIWQIWSRSGDAQTDRLYERGIEQMAASDLDAALATFDDIVQRQPDFAEGWNKRATIHYLMGDNERSLKDCDEVFKRNPSHFGALSGAGQIHLQMGHLRQALDFFQRALEVNPNLDGLERAIPALEQRLQEAERNTI